MTPLDLVSSCMSLKYPEIISLFDHSRHLLFNGSSDKMMPKYQKLMYTKEVDYFEINTEYNHIEIFLRK